MWYQLSFLTNKHVIDCLGQRMSPHIPPSYSFFDRVLGNTEVVLTLSLFLNFFIMIFNLKAMTALIEINQGIYFLKTIFLGKLMVCSLELGKESTFSVKSTQNILPPFGSFSYLHIIPCHTPSQIPDFPGISSLPPPCPEPTIALYSRRPNKETQMSNGKCPLP